MTLSPLLSAGAMHSDARRLIALLMAVLALLAVFAIVVYLSVFAAPTGRAIKVGPDPAGMRPALVKAREPACAAALARARRTRELPVEQAIAASTAMLRTCDIH